jgi:hypothetical protein
MFISATTWSLKLIKSKINKTYNSTPCVIKSYKRDQTIASFLFKTNIKIAFNINQIKPKTKFNTDLPNQV